MTTTFNNSQYVTLKESAELTGKSFSTIRRLLNSNKIKAIKIDSQNGKQWMLDREELLQLIESSKTTSTESNIYNDLAQSDLAHKNFDLAQNENDLAQKSDDLAQYDTQINSTQDLQEINSDLFQMEMLEQTVVQELISSYKDQIHALKEQLEFSNSQLKTKDTQIKTTNQLLENQQILNRQQQLLIAQPKEEVATPKKKFLGLF
jgi:excisionase family DNA binding protein